MTYRCIKPHCPTTCDGCNHAIPNEPGARMLIVQLLDEYAKDDIGNPFEQGDHPLVDEARAFLAIAPVDTARIERNRDMWKAQCERQADELRALRQPQADRPDGVYSSDFRQ